MKGSHSPKIRMAAVEDAESISRIYEPYVMESIATFENDPPSPAVMKSRIENCLQTYPWLAAEEEGAIVGYAYAGAHQVRAGYRWSVNTSVYLAPDCRGKGIGRALYASLFKILTKQRFINAYAAIALPNEASVAIHQAFGFTPVGTYEKVGLKFGAWHDVSWWQKQLNERPSSPEEPIPLRHFNLECL